MTDILLFAVLLLASIALAVSAAAVLLRARIAETPRASEGRLPLVVEAETPLDGALLAMSALEQQITEFEAAFERWRRLEEFGGDIR